MAAMWILKWVFRLDVFSKALELNHVMHSDIINDSLFLMQAPGTLNTALHEAAETNSLGAVKYLLSAGAQASIQNALGELPFDCSNTLDVKK